MRTNDGVKARSSWWVVAGVAAAWLAAGSASAQTTSVSLIAARSTKAVTLPDGRVVSVPVWGYALDANGNGIVDGSEAITVPGPRIVVPPGSTRLEIKLTNLLQVPTSIVIPGQPFAATPVRNADDRVRSMTVETDAYNPENESATHDHVYVFEPVKPGTFLYESGSHPAVQVQMGLYGALTKDQAAGSAYTGVPYATDALLVYSEVDTTLHDAVDDGSYGTPSGPTSTIHYRPSLYLVNGESFTAGAPSIPAGAASQATLLRLVNAGLRTHAPQLSGGRLSVVAEDGNKLPFAKDQAEVMLAAGKTHDALWTPAAAGTYNLYDRMLSLNAPGQGEAGMQAKLRVVAAGTSTAVYANDDSYATGEGVTLNVPAAGVLANDSGAPTTATLLSGASHGTVTLASNGGFSYTPTGGFFGIDTFTYRASSGASLSQPATVGISVQQSQRAPTALGQTFGVTAGEGVAVALGGTDPNGDPLTYYVASLPSHAGAVGSLSYVDPVTRIQTSLGASDLYGSPTRKVVPGGNLVYTPAAGYVGPESFTFVAYDGALPSAPAAIAATVNPPEDAADTSELSQTVALTVKGADGAAIGAYRWTLEEDQTFKVTPGVLYPDGDSSKLPLSVSFHKSYMPVKSAGCWGTGCDSPTQPKVNPDKRYFVSVLPTGAGQYSNGGTEIEAGDSAATVTVSKLPLPTARIRVRVFQDNAPLNGMWDSTEPGLAGFQVTMDDAGGTYGMSGGHQSTDAFGNKIGTKYQACPEPPCDGYSVASLGDGFVLTDADGYAVIENLVMGKYTIKVRAPGGQQWIQTSTIEGGPGVDAWVKPNEPQFFTEFGPPGPHVEVGFTRVTNQLPNRGGFTISGRVTNLRQSRPPDVAQFSGAPFDAKKHTRTWVALNSGATGGDLLYAQPTNEDGTFQIAHVPNGSYQLVVFDKALDLIIGNAVVDVAGAAKNVGDVAVFSWFTNLYAYVFEDKNGDGVHQLDGTEPGIPDQALNIRFRDGSIYQSLTSGEDGFKAFNEVFPFFAWMVAEVDYTRFHSTGLTVVTDAGGDARAGASNAYNWQQQAGLPPGLIPPETLNPQLQPDNANKPFRTESGAETPFLLLEGFQGFIGQSTVMLWGKAPYAKPGSIPEDVNVAPFDDFPGPGDVDANGDGKFNTDQFNGGIAGIIHYGITRAENDPRWAAAENWEPGISDVRVQLWDENRTHLLNEVATDNWNNSVPEGCQWPNNAPYVYDGKTSDCFDGLRNFNQTRPALFDGGYAFSTILQDSVDSATYSLPIEQRLVARPIPAGRYVVKIIVPPGYKLQKEEDKNVDFGDTYIPQQFLLTGYPLADGGGPGDAQPAPTVTDNALVAPFCVGQLHLVPDTLSLFPGEQKGAFAGEMRPLCDAKLVVLRNGQQAAPDFHLFTEAPVSGHVYGMVLDDTTNEYDPNKPTFGEKYAVPFVGISFRDWQGREITRTYSDQNGMYNALVPTTYTINPPEPSGVSPSLLSACINSPTMPGPGGTEVPDPNFQKQYSHFCYPLQYLPGKTTYLDTPVVPTGAFTGNGTLPVDAELPNGTPVIASVSGPGDSGPYIVDRGASDNASRTIVIASAGQVQVPNPAWDGSNAQPKLLARNYGFGSVMGTVSLDGTALPAANVTWSDAQITAIVPSGRRTGQLSLTTSLGRRSLLGVTLSVATPQMDAQRPPRTVQNGQSIQSAIDAAVPGDLILVKPGIHEEMVVMSKPVRLQGYGALTTSINVVTTPAENIQSWLDRMGNLLLSNSAYLLPNQPAMTPAPFQPGDVAAVVGDEGPGVMVMSQNLALGPSGHCLGTFGAPANEAYCLHNENATEPPPVVIDAIARGAAGSGGGGTGFGGRRLVTVTTHTAHGFATGNSVLIQGVTPAAYSGTKTVTRLNSTQFTYTVSNNTGSPTLNSATAQLPPQSPLWKPNARIDGLSLIGASNAPGVLVNGYAHYLEISNDKIYTNSGTFAGGIQLGHPGAAAPFNDEDAQNDHASIHNNVVAQNAANETGGGGGIVLGAGSTNYAVRNNFVAANLTAGNGGGIAHIGRSEVGVIDGNVVVFNESFFQAIGTNGGGIFVGGTPAAAGASTLGSGEVDVTNNLVQGNAASGGDGGGIALLGFVGSDRVHVYNNMIANNVAGLAGGGISIAGLPAGNGNSTIVDIVHNTVVDNDSTGTAGAAFSSPLTSTPQPAGIAGRGSVARVRIANSIVWHNRTFYFGACTPPAGGRCGILPVGATNPTQYAEIQLTQHPYWDLGNVSGAQFAPVSSVLSALSGPSSSANYLAGTNDVTYGSSNTAAAPLFVSQYFNTDRRYAYQVGETTGEATLISTPAALDEGGNFIRPQYGPLSLDNPASNPPNQRFGDYHVTGGLAGAALCGPSGLFTGSCPNAVPAALRTDFDGDSRPTGTPHRGADQATQTVTPPPPPTLSSMTPNSGTRGTASLAVTLLGTNLAGASLVTVSGSGVTCSIGSSSSTSVAATCSIALTAGLGAHSVSVAAAGGTSNALTFTVLNVPAPTLSGISPTSGLRGASNLALALTGTNLAGASAVNVSGSGVSCSVVSSTATSVAASCDISGSATLTARSVTVTAPGGTSNGLTFTVVGPTLTGISPSSSTFLQRGTNVSVTLTGTNLSGATAVTISGNGVSVNSFTVNNNTSVSAVIAVSSSGTGVGSHSVRVVTPAGTTNAVPFTKN